MKWPARLLTDIAAECSHRQACFAAENGKAQRKITPHRVKLGLAFLYWAGQGKSLDAAREIVANRRGLKAPYSAGYVKQIARDFSITFPDFDPGKTLNLPLE